MYICILQQVARTAGTLNSLPNDQGKSGLVTLHNFRYYTARHWLEEKSSPSQARATTSK